jgi:ribose 5-phosphate isomerase
MLLTSFAERRQIDLTIDGTDEAERASHCMIAAGTISSKAWLIGSGAKASLNWLECAGG